jgi:leucyl-tRNA synthetase
MVELAVQINGKLRDTIVVAVDANQEVIETAAFASAKVQSFTQDKEIARKIHVKGRLLNIVVKG